MRFDDMLATVLAQPAETPLAQAALWRQLVDLAAQRRGASSALTAAAQDRLRALSAEMPIEVRMQTARAIAGRALPPAVVALFADQPPAVAAPVLGTATMSDADWLGLLPALSPVARALLRHRRDLAPAVSRALDSFGAADFAIGGDVSPAAVERSGPGAGEASIAELAALHRRAAPSEGPGALADGDDDEANGSTQIRTLMARIDAFRRRPPSAQDADEPLPAQDFRFETSADGVIGWVSGIVRGALIGETIALPGEGLRGVDGHVSGAYRQRAPFRDARLCIAGVGDAAGEWRISAVPFFDRQDGRFLGYRGTGRRPRIDESAVRHEPAAGLFGSGMAADSLRQLVHELRTPINAISGFAEMIEHQMLGPAPDPYRERAADIVRQSGRLIGAIDDLDLAARIETHRLGLAREPVDLTGLLALAIAEHGPLADSRGATMVLNVQPEVPLAAGDLAALARICGRLVGSAVSLAGVGEVIAVRLAAELERLRVDVTRPIALDGLDEEALLDPGYGPGGESPDAPALGLGFSLRLVRNLAAAAQGALEIGEHAFILHIPSAIDEALAEGQG